MGTAYDKSVMENLPNEKKGSPQAPKTGERHFFFGLTVDTTFRRSELQNIKKSYKELTKIKSKDILPNGYITPQISFYMCVKHWHERSFIINDSYLRKPRNLCYLFSSAATYSQPPPAIFDCYRPFSIRSTRFQLPTPVFNTYCHFTPVLIIFACFNPISTNFFYLGYKSHLDLKT